MALVFGFWTWRPKVIVEVGEGVAGNPSLRRFTFKNEGETDAYDVRWKVRVPEIVRAGNRVQRNVTHHQLSSIPVLENGEPSTEFQNSEAAVVGPEAFIIRGTMRVEISYGMLWGLWRISRVQEFNARNDGHGGTEWLPSKKSVADQGALLQVIRHM